MNKSFESTKEEIREALLQAIQEDETAEVKRLLTKKSCSPDDIDEKGFSLMHYAVMKPSLEMVKVLIKCGANVNTKSGTKKIPLHYAIISGNIDLIQFLIKNGANVNAATTLGNSPLHFATMVGNIEAVKTLLKSKAKINHCNILGESPIFNAAANYDIPMTEYLVSQGASIKLLGEDKMNLIQRALMGPSPSDPELKLYSIIVEERRNHPKLLSYVKYCASLGLSLNTLDEGKNSSLALAALMGQTDCAKFFIENGVNVNSYDSINQTALQHAVYYGHFDIVKLLLENNATVDSISNSKKNVIHSCAAGGDVRCMELILQAAKGKKQLINGVDCYGNTPLHLACRRNHPKVVELLLQYGADVNNRSYEYCTPAVMTCVNEFKDLFKPGVADPLMGRQGVEDQSKEFLDQDEDPEDWEENNDVEDEDNIDETSLSHKESPHLKEFYEKREMLEKVLESIVDDENCKALMDRAIHDNYKYDDDSDEDAEDETSSDTSSNGVNADYFHELKNIATDAYYTEEFKCIIENITPAALLRSDHIGNLRFKQLEEIDLNRVETMKVLINHGADLSVSHPNGDNLLALAVLHGLYELAKLLIEHNVSVNPTDKKAKNMLSPLGRACLYNKHNMIELLLDNGARLNQTDNLWRNHISYISSPQLLKRVFQAGDIHPNTLLLWNYKVKIPNHYLNSEDRIEPNNPTGITSFHSPVTLLMRYIRKKQFHMVKTLLDEGADPLVITEAGTTVLHDAAYSDQLDILNLLLPSCLPILNHQDKRGFSPIFLAAQNGSIKTITALCEAGADLTLRCNQGRTVLHYVVLSKSVESLEYLYKCHPNNLSVVDNYKSSVLHYCVSEKYTDESLDYLLTLPCVDSSLQDSYGLSSIDVALKNKRNNIVPLLVKKRRTV